MARPLKPIYKKWDNEQGVWLWGLDREDFDRVRKGYACDRCLEPFESPQTKCPVCKNEIQIILDTPAEWR